MKSKNLFILFIIPAFFIYACGQIPAYRQLSSFSGDTLAYLKYNFENNRVSYYSGKNMETFLNDLEIPVKCFYPAPSGSVNNGICNGIIFAFDDNYTFQRKTYNNITSFCLYVKLQTLVKRSSIDSVLELSGSNNWNPTLANFFGKMIINSFNASVLPDPEKEASLCDPSSSKYDIQNCTDNSVSNYYDFSENLDLSSNYNSLMLHDGAETNGYLELTGSNPWDYLHPHATAVNSPSLNPQYISVAARIKPEEFVGCGNDVIVSKPFTSHIAPYYQYHLGICGTYCGGGGHYFSFACSINGRSEGMYSPANAWIPDQWYTVVGTYDGSMMKLYVNGSLVVSKTVSGSVDSYPTDLFIGKQGNMDYSIPAEIDWVKTYNRPLSDTEVQALSGQ